MRRSILHVALASLVALTMAGCADDITPTVTAPASRVDAAKPPGGGDSPPKPPVGEPPRIAPTDFVDITAGEYHTCARRFDGTVFCWGLDDMAQIGMAPKSTSCSGCVDRPRMVFAGTNAATMIDAGDNHTCMIDTAGDTYCWGSGSQGQIGNSAISGMGSSAYPIKITAVQRFTVIAAGGRSTCATGPAGIYCWGEIQGGALVPSLVSTDNYFVALTLGERHVCGIDGPTRLTYCWGANNSGQMLRSPNTGMTPFAVQATLPTTISRITTQSNFTCAEFTTTGQVQCAGENGFGQLGSGLGAGFTGSPQAVGNGASLHGISTGYNHACALDRNNLAWCWGGDSQGQLGNGTATNTIFWSTPQQVLSDRTFRAIATGRTHTCAIGTDNQIYCWGDNTYGQLGIGATGNAWHPVPTYAP